MSNESQQLEEKIDRLTKELQRHNSWLWVIWRALLGAVASTVGVIFVLTVGVYILHKLNLVPGLNLLIDQVLPTLERYGDLRGL